MITYKDVAYFACCLIAAFSVIIYITEYTDAGCSPENIDYCGHD